MAVKNATQLLDHFCAAGIAVEVTHRSKRRLFGLRGVAPVALLRRAGIMSAGARGAPRCWAPARVAVPPPTTRLSNCVTHRALDASGVDNRGLPAANVRPTCDGEGGPDGRFG